MLVMKFGGTSVADAQRIDQVAELVLGPTGPVVVVTSALGGVTDELIRAGEMARGGRDDETDAAWAGLADRHRVAAEGVTDPGPARDALARTLDERLHELRELLHGVRLLRELSPRSADLLVSFGERLSAPIVAAALAHRGVEATAVDAREFLVTTDPGGEVDLEASRDRTRQHLLPAPDRSVRVVTGFIASGPDGHTTTLGRGGSDYTATLVGSFIDADEIWIWTDVDGVMTADPRVVPEARVLPAITYREAAEMAYFGSRVLHPRTMTPAVRQDIPVVIRNTFNPGHAGTRISAEHAASALGVKTVTSIGNLSLITVEGNGMIGVPGVARRVFATTAGHGVNVFMVSQASSEHNISFVVQESDGPAVTGALQEEFDREIARGQVDRVDHAGPVGIVAVIGEGMKGTPGISERMFTALGRARINVLAIAQGSSELNLSTVVSEPDLRRAVGAAHSRFGLTRDTHLVVLGKGLVGRALLGQIANARQRLADTHGIGLPVIGICGRGELAVDLRGFSGERLRRIADGAPLEGEPRPDDETLLRRLDEMRWLDIVVVDVTAEPHGPLHLAALEHGFHVVTANKKPMAGPLDTHDAILAAATHHGVGYHFETTFGAGLPALSTLQDLLATCDEVRHVTGCFSGTLGYICTELERGRPFSEAVREARDRGYTEPDPRDDLSGTDVARKALIIARQLGGRLEMDDITLETLVGDSLMAIDDPDAFLDRLPEADADIARRVNEAAEKGCVLRYVAEITPERVTVGLRAVPADSPTGQLAGPDNILVFETERYRENPLIIRGPGAGAEVTAAGVLGDVLKIARAR